MKDTLVALCESEVGFAPSILTYNKNILKDIEPVSESEAKLLKYDVNKVIVNGTSDGDCLVEYSENLEKYITDYNLTLEDAIENIASKYDLLKESIIIVIDESCIDKLDIKALKDNFNVKVK